MTVNEMHIAVNLGVQKIASFQVDNLLPEEIDHELNLAMMRFIKQRYNPMSNRMGKGFEQSQKRIDDLRHLVVQYAGYSYFPYLDAVFNTNTSPIHIDRLILPLDYLFLVSVRGKVSHNCKNVITPLISNKTYRFVEIDLTPPSPGYFITGMQRYDGTNWVDIFNTPLGQELTYQQLLDVSTYNFQIFPFIGQLTLSNGMLANSTTIEDSPIANPNRLYVSTNPSSTVDFWTPDSGGNFIRTIWINSSGMGSAQYIYSSKLNTESVQTRSFKAGFSEVKLAKYSQHDDVFTLLGDPFNQTDYKTPVYTIQENNIDFYSDNTFVVEYGIINYIRKPKPINLSLGQGCELAEHTHDEIVEMTIKSILEGIQDPRYQSQSIENLESE